MSGFRRVTRSKAAEERNRDSENINEASPGLSKNDKDFKSAAAKKETQSKKSEHKESKDATDLSSVSSKLSPRQETTEDNSREETSSTVLVRVGEPDNSSESEKEATEMSRKHLSAKDKILDPAGPDVTSVNDKKTTIEVSTEDDLDEMMDIGTVDQVEQEAQMQEEEQNSFMDVDSSQSCHVFTSSATGDANFIKEEDDVKPTGLQPPSDEDQGCRSTASSEAIAGRDSSSPASLMNGMNVVKLDKVSNEIKLSISPSLVKVKDEPADDEYEQALISCESTATVKDEPNIAKEDLRIGSVFSVTAESQTLPTINPSSLQMFCSHCKKNLLKGQTAFQRKGSPALFCSTTCLSTSLPAVKGLSKFCHHCQKLLLRPLDTVLAPDEKGTMKEFCSQNCLTSFNHKNSTAKKTPQSPAPQSLCSMCTKHCISKHEVILNSTAHKLCSDTCFKRFRTVNNLSMANCANCEVYCHSKPLLLKLEGGNKILCNLECLSKYKKTNKTNQPCTMCHTTRLLAEMVYNRNTDDSVNLFCSSSCVMAFKVQTVSTSGARVDCDCCGKKTVPAYHLAMSDTSIRNFCTLPCVMNFQEKFRKSQKHVNVFTKLPTGPIKNQAITLSQPPQHVSKEARNLSCSQCNSIITFKPEVIQIKDNLYFVCNADCSHELKKAYSVTCVCEYCKMEKISRDAKRINNRDCFFCSDGCELLFRHDLNKNWGKHCTSCTYCHSVSQKLVTAQYGGSTEEFCSEGCRSKYTMLFCHVAMCDTCGRKGKLKQSLPMLGEVKNFCDLTCLLQFCCDKAAMQSEVLRGPSGTREATPVIANVISLAGAKSNASDRTALQSIKEHTGRTPNFLSKKSGHISIQTDTLKSHCPPGQKMLKNKALLCRPLVQNKGVSCKTQMVDCEAQTDGAFPQIMIVPVPVPVYIPVPMNMYTQCTPRPVGLPLPVPVPMFLPVTIDSAERIVETIQEIKEKIPSDPFEAEIILMAEMVAEQEGTADKEETPKEKEVERETEKRIEPATDDHASNYSDDLDTDDLASFLNNWEDASSDTGLTSPSQHCSNEKLNPSLDSPVGTSSEHSPEAPPPAPPTMDIEADVTVESLEKLAQLREQSQRSLSPPPSTERRRQAPRKAREKKGRKSQRLSETVKVSSQRHSSIKPKVYDIPKLKSQYGVDAWKRWILWRRNQHDLEKPRFARSLEMKEDVLRCTTAELSYGLCCFINEIRRPNGEPYSPDSLFYLCLGIQQHLFENGRVENIFMDRFYNKFSIEFTNMLRSFKPSITARGYIHSRVEEEFLWDCKQLGAYSPIVLLNTLLFFCCKYFGFTMVEQHRQLSFAHVMRCTKTNQDNSKTIFLRFYPPIPVHETEPEVPTKRRKEEQSKEDVLEMMENTENPLRCPVRLYEFYLSKCSESVKQRTNMFYLHPERSCVPNSPLWFSSTPLEDSTIEAMLIRILTVRELHTTTKKEDETEQDTSDDPSFIPDDEDSE